MKRTGNLFERIVAWDNLQRAYLKARRGKSGRAEVIRYGADLDRNLRELGEQLRQGTMPFGRFHQFVIYDPKERIITAPVFSERVAHHAIMNICEPILDRWLIPTTYACRRGRGRVKALEWAARHAGKHGFYLQLDVRKYFDSISHERLLSGLEHHFKDKALLDVFEKIVRGYRCEMGRGVPIGSLTSQHFANFYLGRLDRTVKEQLQIPAYVRYMDDMVLWSDRREELQEALSRMTTVLRDDLDLQWKKTPDLNRTAHGMNFLGCRVFSNRVELNRRSKIRFRRRIRVLEDLYAEGLLSEQEMQEKQTALVAFARAGKVSSWRFRKRVLYQE